MMIEVYVPALYVSLVVSFIALILSIRKRKKSKKQFAHIKN